MNLHSGFSGRRLPAPLASDSVHHQSFWSISHGKKSSRTIRGHATTLEWQAPTTQPHGNFWIKSPKCIGPLNQRSRQPTINAAEFSGVESLFPQHDQAAAQSCIYGERGAFPGRPFGLGRVSIGRVSPGLKAWALFSLFLRNIPNICTLRKHNTFWIAQPLTDPRIPNKWTSIYSFNLARIWPLQCKVDLAIFLRVGSDVGLGRLFSSTFCAAASARKSVTGRTAGLIFLLSPRIRWC